MHSTNPFDLANSAEEESVPTIVQNGLKALDAGAMKNLKRTKDGWKVGPFLIRATGVEAVSKANRAQWQELGEYLASLGSKFQIWLGDWAYYAIHNWNMTYEEISEAIGGEYTAGSLRVYASVMSRIPLLTRVNNLTFKHYAVLAKLNDDDAIAQWAAWAGEQGKVPGYRKLEEAIFGKEASDESHAKSELADAYKDLKRFAEEAGVSVGALLAVAANIAASGSADGETPLLAALTEEQYERLQRHRQYIAEGSKFEALKRYELPARELHGWVDDSDVDPDEVLIVTISRTKRE